MFLGKIVSSHLMGKKKLLIITQSILEIKLKFLGKILDGSYSEALTCTQLFKSRKQIQRSQQVASRASSSSSRLLIIFINANKCFQNLFFWLVKTLQHNLLVYTIEWKWNLHLGRLKVFRFFLDQIVITYNGGQGIIY